MAECLLTIVGRKEMGIKPTTNGKRRPQHSVVVPVSDAFRGKCVYRSALADHVLGCQECDPNKFLLKLLDERQSAFGTWEQFSRRLLEDPRTDRAMAFAVAWRFNPLKAMTLPLHVEDVMRGFEMAPKHHFERKGDFQLFVEDDPDGYMYHHDEDLVKVLSRPHSAGTRLLFDRGPRIRSIPAERRDVVAAAIELRRAGWPVDGSSPRNFWDIHTMWAVEFS